MSHHQVHGYLAVPASAQRTEEAHQIDFPVSFAEVPAFEFGAELPGEYAAPHPTVSVVVTSWLRDDNGHVVGAQLAVVVSPHRDDMVIHWNARGECDA